jgi:hypothetical protein
MEQRQKIIIPTSDEPLSTPHFNQSTVLSARPVVPLTPGQNTSARLSKLFPMSALIIAAAIAVGIAGGLLIGLRNNNQSAAALAPAATDAAQTSAPASQVETHNQSAPLVSGNGATPEKTASVETRSGTQASIPVKDSNSATAATSESSSTREKKKQNSAPLSPQQSAPVSPVTVRERTNPRADVYNTDQETRAERRAAREQRRREVDDQSSDAVTTPLPRRVERGTQQLNRIKEIFEGQKP